MNYNGGQLFIKDGSIIYIPGEGTDQPVLYPGENIDIMVNGKPLLEPVSVGPSDTIEVIAETVLQNPRLLIELSEDKYTATLKVIPQIVQVSTLLEQPPQRELRPVAIVTTQTIVPYSEEDISAFLASQNITHGILRDKFPEVLSASGQKVVVAQGTPPTPPVDDVIEEYFQKEVLVNQFKVGDTIDYKEHLVIPQVNPGDILAELKPGRPGSPGITVTGETIEPRPMVKSYISAGKGTVQVGNQIQAQEAGRPRVEGSKTRRYSVEKAYVVSSNVNIRTGNIRYVGDLIVYGNVEEGMTVSASGDVFINGNVYGATIAGGKSITITGHTVKSTILGDQTAQHYKKAAEDVAGLHSSLVEIMKKMLQFKQQTGVTDADRLNLAAKALINQQYPDLKAKFAELAHFINKELDTEKFPPEISQILPKLNIQKQSLNEMIHLPKELSALEEYFLQQTDSSCNIKTGGLQHTTIITTGDVEINAEECFYSNITADGFINARCKVRDGQLFAGKGMFVSEVGSPWGIQTVLSVPEDQTIKAALVYENTIINIGKAKHIFPNEQRNVTAFNEDGLVRVY